jgi:hypothetical protein
MMNVMLPCHVSRLISKIFFCAIFMRPSAGRRICSTLGYQGTHIAEADLLEIAGAHFIDDLARSNGHAVRRRLNDDIRYKMDRTRTRRLCRKRIMQQVVNPFLSS